MAVNETISAPANASGPATATIFPSLSNKAIALVMETITFDNKPVTPVMADPTFTALPKGKAEIPMSNARRRLE
ncbi:MAG: hypothetical protein WCD81_06650 [Candidatus Bathyarchaeia archaeon]